MKRQNIIDKVTVYLEKQGIQPQGTLLMIQGTEITKEFILENLMTDFVESEMNNEIAEAEKKAALEAWKAARFHYTRDVNCGSIAVEMSFNKWYEQWKEETK